MRWSLPVLLALAVLASVPADPASAQQGKEPAPDPFAMPRPGLQPWEARGLRGAVARHAESLALMQRRISKDPTDLEALERTCTLLEPMGRQVELIPAVRKSLETRELEAAQAAALRGLLGHLLVEKADGMGGFAQIIIIGGGAPQGWRVQRDEGAIELYKEAEIHLREALKHNAKDLRALHDLIEALDGIDDAGRADELRRLRTELAAATSRVLPPGVQPMVFDLVIEELRSKALAMETLAENPDHGFALPLRRKALVLEFCNRTIPFEYRASLYGPVSLLAPGDMVQNNLTRYYRKLDGETDTVPVQYYAPTPRARDEVVRGLATDPSDNATAALLAVLRRATAEGPIEEAALESLLKGERKSLRRHLPSLLAIALTSEEDGNYPAHGQRYLVRLAGRMRLTSAAPILVAALVRERDLFCPRGIVTALGRIGRPEDTEVLLRIARDPKEDVYFRRRAVDALARMAAALPNDLAANPQLELSVAVARYRAEPTEARRGRILAALEDEHLADDAAEYCVELNLREAIPALERLARDRARHYSGRYLAEALAEMRARSRG